MHFSSQARRFSQPIDCLFESRVCTGDSPFVTAMLSFSLIVRYLLSACSSSPFTLLVSALPASKLAIYQYDLEAPHFHSGVFETHPNHHIAKKQMRDFGGMMSFSLKDNSIESALKVLSNTHLFALAESLGGVESLIGHPASMTHASIPKEEREKSGVTDSLIRLSVGVEDVEDLIEDLKAALA